MVTTDTTMKRMETAQVRVEKVLHLGTMHCFMCYPSDALKEFMEDLDEENVKTLPELGWLRSLVEKVVSGDIEEEEFEEAFLEHVVNDGPSGFVIQAATPEECSWGLYFTAYFYGDTYEEALEKCVAWAQRLHKRGEGQ